MSLLVFLCLLAAAPAALAGTGVTWSAPRQFDGRPPFGTPYEMWALGCNPTLCVTGDAAGRILTSTSPSGGAATWTVATPARSSLYSASCANDGLCVLGDDAGDVISSTNPAAGTSAWTVTNVDPGKRIVDIDCPSIGFCAALDSVGNLLVSADPTGGAGAWSVRQVPGSQGTHISCASPMLCVIADNRGAVFASTDPLAGPSSWRMTVLDESAQMVSVSCPSATLCLASDSHSHLWRSTDPSAGDWTSTSVAGYSLGLISCPNAGFCAVMGGPGVLVTHDPGDRSPTWAGYAAPPAARLDCTSATFCAITDQFNFDISLDGGVTWQVANVDGVNQVAALACPSKSLCTALDDHGRILFSSTPGDPSAWYSTVPARLSGVDSEAGELACPSTTFCLAAAGVKEYPGSHFSNVVYAASTSPASGPWNIVLGGFWYGGSLATSCASAALCVQAARSPGSSAAAGRILTSANPGASLPEWHETDLPGQPISAVACSSTSLCVLGDVSGTIWSSTNPNGGAAAWRPTVVDPSRRISSLSCVGSQLCVGLDSAGNVLVSGTATKGAWKITHLPFTQALTHLDCPSASLCVALDGAGDVAQTTDPVAGGSSWSLAHIDDQAEVSAVACADSSFCLAADRLGNLLVGTGPGEPSASVTHPPTRRDVLAALTATLKRPCKQDSLGRLANAGKCAMHFRAPSAGTLTITWRTLKGRKLAAAAAKPAKARKLTVNVKLTRQAKRQFEAVKKVTWIRVRVAFTPQGGKAVVKSQKFRYGR